MTAQEIIEAARKEKRNALTEHEAKLILSEYGVLIPKEKTAKNLHEAFDAAEEIGYPIVLKVISPEILHKSDVGGVIYGVKCVHDVERGYKKIIENVKRNAPNAKIEGILVQEFAPKGEEIIVGITQDPQFGPVIVLGMGGIFVEIMRDVSMRVAPIAKTDAQEMIQEIKGYPILKGFRGRPPADIEAIV
ncbi:MAG: acetate--CoA ligase family protein, partial [Euryarchaeota archaeon]|nr:acetate--CoA ligase family protein [Euryarchaeota archaeon]